MSVNAQIEAGFEDLPWYAVWTFSAKEKLVFRKLHDLDLCPYLPRRREKAVIRGMKVDVETPMFAGYCFLRPPIFGPEQQLMAIGVDGVGGLLMIDDYPARIPHMQLANPFYADILASIKALHPYDPIFRSRRQMKREVRTQQHLAKSRSA